MTQKEASALIKFRTPYRHFKGKIYFVTGFGVHHVNKVRLENGEEEKEKDVILVTQVPEIPNDDEPDVIIMPVLQFVKPTLDGSARFTEIV